MYDVYDAKHIFAIILNLTDEFFFDHLPEWNNRGCWEVREAKHSMNCLPEHITVLIFSSKLSHPSKLFWLTRLGFIQQQLITKLQVYN